MLGLHSHAACHPPPRHGIPGPAGLWGSAPGQEGGCKMNHSCNMRESTWSLWRSLKTLRLWQAGPRLLPEGPGLAAAGGHAGAESCRTRVAMSQGRNGNTAGHFSGAGATGKPLANRTCQSPPADCAFPSEPVASRAALRPTHCARARRHVRVDTPYGPCALWGPALPVIFLFHLLFWRGWAQMHALGCCSSSACVVRWSCPSPVGCSRCDPVTSHPALAASFSRSPWAFLLPLGVWKQFWF